MSVNNFIVDGRGRGNVAKVNGEGELSVVVHPHPPIDEEVEALPYRAYFENPVRGNNMVYNGSINNADYSVNASEDFDIYIKKISVLIGDGGSPSLNDFGDLAALSNGIEWVYFNQDQGEYVLHDGIKTNLEFLRTGTTSVGFGTGVDAFLADVSGGGTEKSYLPQIDLADAFGMTYGLRLKKGTTDKLVFRVRDNLSNLTTFNIIAYGLRL